MKKFIKIKEHIFDINIISQITLDLDNNILVRTSDERIEKIRFLNVSDAVSAYSEVIDILCK